MKKEYWDVSNEQVVAKTGKTIEEWVEILSQYQAHNKKSNEVVAYLQSEFEVPRYWARTLTTRYLKQ
ncbi:DUF4287 domain-containing protein [Flavobacterium aciduliphilum]|uniref:Uncharacterized protein DUF4287 n=1 Tax=Flavobacterium aciduliphilum TaxID=1101402 RepID=A0A328YQZ7_9FLAO|nr:DUF4287 domain-containing protein [Flavobacterium aciduliphilum]RAR75553.1 uncharacterized protein DUF4287 [Flavobacterium aciduliphilum]